MDRDLSYRGKPGPPCHNLEEVKSTVRAFAKLIEADEREVEQLLMKVETVCNETNGRTFVERDPHLSTMQLALTHGSLLLNHRKTWMYHIAPDAVKLQMDKRYLKLLWRMRWEYGKAMQGFRMNVEKHVARRAELARKRELAQSVVAAWGSAPRQRPAVGG
jgi:hypothetical protein